MLSCVAGNVNTTWQHHWSVLSTSQGVLLIMRGTAECSARQMVERWYPDKQANCPLAPPPPPAPPLAQQSPPGDSCVLEVQC